MTTRNEVVDAEFEVATPAADKPYLYGVIAEMKEGGFGFITEVTDPYGQRVALNGDVFVGELEARLPLEVGLRLEFNLEPDPKREGKFKAINIALARHLPIKLQIQPASPLALLSARIGYHDHVKNVPAVEVAKALNNNPLGIASADSGEIYEIEDGQALARLIATYLNQTFPGLRSVGITMSPIDAGSESERALIEEQVTDQRDLEMIAAAVDLAVEYEIYVATCKTLLRFVAQGYLRTGMSLSVQSLKWLLGEFQNGTQLANADEPADVLAARAETTLTIVNGLRDAEILQPCSILPFRHLPDLFMACPVWFVWKKGDNLPDTSQAQDPTPDAAVRYLANLVGEQAFADVYQMWNRRTRPLKAYRGDKMPPHIVKAIRKAKELFDFVVIATPYHDIAGREWQSPDWGRLIDPYLLGFKEGVPFLFVLGRWSDSGIFPLMGELVADTIAYLRANKRALVGFGGAPYWFRVGSRDTTNSLEGAGLYLQNLADQLIAHFEAGTLFDFIRGTLRPSAPAA